MFLHVINSLGGGGAEKQLREYATRSSYRQEVIDLENLGRRPVLELRQTLAARQPYAVMAWLERSQIATALAANGATPLVANVCGLPRRRGWRRPQLIAALARYDAYVTNSEIVRRATRGYARPLTMEWFEVVPNGVEDAPQLHRRQAIEGPLRVGFIGRGDRAKGVDILASALGAFEPQDVQATLVGRVVQQAIAGLSSPAIGAIHDGAQDPWSIVGEIDVLVVPSRSEGSPNVVIEAFARGVPVIATDAGGTVELLADGRGTLVPREDPAALADALRAIRRHWDYAIEAAERARKYVIQVHAWPRVVAGYDALLERVAGR